MPALSPANEYAQVAGKITQIDILGEGRGRRLTARLQDETGEIELVWFQGISWIQKAIAVGSQYLVFGKLSFFIGKPQIAHPEIENFTEQKADGKYYLEPVYPSTEKLKAKGIKGRAIGKFTYALLQILTEKDLPENLPESIISQYKFISRFNACRQIHFPATDKHYQHAVRRLKFEELFFAQLRLGLIKSARHRHSKGSGVWSGWRAVQ